jgi:hypothetical protein
MHLQVSDQREAQTRRDGSCKEEAGGTVLMIVTLVATASRLLGEGSHRVPGAHSVRRVAKTLTVV